MPHTPSPRPHLLRYVASRGSVLVCIERAYGDDDYRNSSRRVQKRGTTRRFTARTLCARPTAIAVSHVTTRTGSCAKWNLLALALAALGACGPAINEVRIEPGTTPLKPVFVLTDTTGRAPSGTIYGLSVVPCGADSAVWQIVANGSNSAPSRFTYGEAPPGYIVNTGPAPLRAGCYDVFVTDGRRSRFRVDAAGHLIVDGRRDTLPR
jgi:hypothetical protein